MPALIGLYLTALLYYHTSASCVALAEALQHVSHDRTTCVAPLLWVGFQQVLRAHGMAARGLIPGRWLQLLGERYRRAHTRLLS